MNVTGPEVPFLLEFEDAFQPEEAKAWMRSWWHLSIVCSSIYAVAIHAGQYAMSKRAPMTLRGPMTVWSALLAVFSICGTIRILPTIHHIYSNFGFFYVICDCRFYYLTGSDFWTYAFATSKLFELGDTVFIVLRKQKLSFLHWYHHITVFIYCWFSYSYDSPSGLIFGGMNYVVHSLMYSYYTLRALKISMPNLASMLLTSLQIVQMFIGIIVSVTIYKYKHQGLPCHETYNNLSLAFVMYLSYLLLFAHFFYERYMHKSQKAVKPAATVSNGKKVSNGVHASNGRHAANGDHANGGVTSSLNGHAKKSK
jgi:elongation of very long chain fatty acids protein 6